MSLKFNFKKNILSNTDLYNLSEMLNLPLNGIYMKDEITLKNLKNGNYIMNLQNHNQNGSHWVSFLKINKTIFYFDSFGMPAPQNEYDLFFKQHDKILYNKHQIQDINSHCCGYFAIAFLYMMNKNNLNLTEFINMFAKQDLTKNDSIVKSLIKKSVKK